MEEDVPDRTFGQSPDLVIPDDFDAPLPDDELASWGATSADARSADATPTLSDREG